jgi:hypothetical protein
LGSVNAPVIATQTTAKIKFQVKNLMVSPALETPH